MQGREDMFFVILSEAKNLSWVLCLHSNRREILRFAQNDNVLRFLSSFAACKASGYFEGLGSL
jgi:hypothetical protein